MSGDSTTLTLGLSRQTVYTVGVAAETSAGTGIYSDPLIFETPESSE